MSKPKPPRIFAADEFENYAAYLPAYRELEAELKTHKLVFLPDKKDFVENRLRLPSFCQFTFDFLKQERRAAIPDEAWASYRPQLAELIVSRSLDESDERAIEARFRRAYASLMRDLHMVAWLRDVAKTAVILANPVLDSSYGIDVMIQYAGQNVGVCLFTNTTRARAYREVKGEQTVHSRRSKPFENVAYIDVRLIFQGRDMVYGLPRAQNCGDYLLYTAEHVKYIVKKTQALAKEKTHATDDRHAGPR